MYNIKCWIKSTYVKYCYIYTEFKIINKCWTKLVLFTTNFNYNMLNIIRRQCLLVTIYSFSDYFTFYLTFTHLQLYFSLTWGYSNFSFTRRWLTTYTYSLKLDFILKILKVWNLVYNVLGVLKSLYGLCQNSLVMLPNCQVSP